MKNCEREYNSYMNNYYDQKQFISKVNKKGEVIGRIEKWEAHKKGILHRAISVTLIYKNQYIIQHRKHPAFDGIFDLTSSSHQIFIDDTLQSSKEAAYECIKREWNIGKNELIGEIKEVGEIYYRARDPNSIYKEHEKCIMLVAKIKNLPTPNFDFAYGFSLVDKNVVADKNSLIYKNLAPWSKKAIENKLI